MRYIIIALIAAFVIAFFLGGFFNSRTVVVFDESTPLILRHYEPYTGFLENTNTSTAAIKVPAVDNEGNGVTTVLFVQIVPGFGKALVNIDKLIFWGDTQNSIRTARSVAEEITGANLSEYDLVYTVTANASVIEGPSAGAALTIATIGAIKNKRANESVMITGTIKNDGKIGQVGEVLTKAKAAKDVGAELFLVPPKQSYEVKYETKRECKSIGLTEVCDIITVPTKVYIEDEVDIAVREVNSIEEAMGYFFA